MKRIVSALGLLVLVAACGQKGPLYRLPPAQPDAPAAANEANEANDEEGDLSRGEQDASG